MIFIDPNEIESRLPQELKEKLLSATEDLMNTPAEERRAFIDRKDDLWRELRPFLAAVTSKDKDSQNPDYKCWYCEDKTSRFTYHVDHFRPKGRIKDRNQDPEPGYWWLAFDFKNYRLCCEYCNVPHKDNEDEEARGKWDQFPIREGTPRANDPNDILDEEIRLLIDPTKINEVFYLSFEDTGFARPRIDDEDNYQCQMACETIRVLNLNHWRIVEARKQVWSECQRLVNKGNVLRDQLGRGSPVINHQFATVCYHIRAMTRPWSEFSAMAKACFLGSGAPWVSEVIAS